MVDSTCCCHAHTFEGVSLLFHSACLQISFQCRCKKNFVATSSPEARLEVFGVVGRLLTATSSEVYELDIRNLCRVHQVFDNFGPTCFEYFMEKFQSLYLAHLEIDEDQIGTLGAISRPCLDIKLAFCRISGASAEALAEVLQRNQGPTELIYCDIDNFILADGLRGNSRLINLRVLCLSSTNEVGNREVLAITSALRENKGLVNLVIRLDLTMSDESWSGACDSLKTLIHSTLQILHVESIQSYGVSVGMFPVKLRLCI